MCIYRSCYVPCVPVFIFLYSTDSVLFFQIMRLFCINSLTPGKLQFNFRKVIFKLTSVNGGWGISYEIALKWMPQDLTDDESTLVQVMDWCRQAKSHYMSQSWPRSMSPNGVTRPQWVNITHWGLSQLADILQAVFWHAVSWQICWYIVFCFKFHWRLFQGTSNSPLVQVLVWCNCGVVIGVNIGSGNSLLPDGTKPLPKPMLTCHPWILWYLQKNNFPEDNLGINL